MNLDADSRAIARANKANRNEINKIKNTRDIFLKLHVIYFLKNKNGALIQ